MFGFCSYLCKVCYYNDDISSNSQAGQRNTGTRCYGQLVRVLQKTRFTSFQSVYDCLSVRRHNVSPRVHNRYLSQLSLLTFKLLFYNNMCRFYVIVYGDIKIYRSNVKTLRFLEPCPQCFLLRSSGTKQPIASICCTIKHRYTNFRSYVNFHKMRDVPGFHSAGHNWTVEILPQVGSSMYFFE